MQNRIDRLEGLVLSLMTNGPQAAGPTAANRALSMSNSTGSTAEYPQDIDVDNDDMIKEENEEFESETDQVAKSLGVLKVFDNKSMYFGDAHWAAILNEIGEVRNYYAEHKKKYEDHWEKVETTRKSQGFTQGPAFLFGGRNLPPYAELLASLPSRDVVDKLVRQYFNDHDPTVHILHPPSWQRKYEKHWKDPSKTDAAWLGQLYAVMCLAMQSYHRYDTEPPEYKGKSLELANDYRALTAQCLLIADYTRPVVHIIDTLILHLHGEFARSRDADVGIWVLIGIIVRLAMRMGFHRDPKYYPNVSPFMGEMRRRVWRFVRQADLLFSFQIGLPSMIRQGDCDTALPRNLYDEDFDEDTTELPPSRPPSTPTPVSYMIAKADIAIAFGNVVEHLHKVTTCPYEEIIKLDNELQEARAQIPPHLQLRTIEESVLDPATTIMQRLNLSILYHKGQCVLHRKILARARLNNRYAHSRRTCIDSSMELLHHQAVLHFESRPGKRLISMKWYIDSLTTHDFLLAATLVALDLYYTAQGVVAGRSSGDVFTWGIERRPEMMQSLEVSRNIWFELRDQSMEAFKASEILTVMLDKLKRMQAQARKPATPITYQGMMDAMNRAPAAYTPPDDEKLEHSAAMTLGMLSSGGRVGPDTTNPFGGGGGGAFSQLPGGNTNFGNVQPTGLTPGSSSNSDQMSVGNGISSAPSPFSLLTNTAPMELPTNLDWVSCCLFHNPLLYLYHYSQTKLIGFSKPHRTHGIHTCRTQDSRPPATSRSP